LSLNKEDHKEIWTTYKIIEDLHYNLISAKREDGLRKYEQQVKFLLYRIPVWRKPETANKQPLLSFTVDLKDITEEVKEQLTAVSQTEAKSIVKEAVSIIFENPGPNEKEYFNKSVMHLLEVQFN
jgi:hypothetical protein